MGWLRCHLSTAYALPRTRKTNHRVTSCSSHLERASDPCAQCSAVVCGANRGEWLLSALRMCHLASYVTLALPGNCTRRRGYSPLWVALGASAVLCPGTCSPKAYSLRRWRKRSGRAVPSLRRPRLPILSVKPILGQALADRRDFFPCDPSVIARRRSIALRVCVRGVSCILDTGAYIKVTRTCVSPLRSLRIGYMEVEL
jgi:hypothetical protein